MSIYDALEWMMDNVVPIFVVIVVLASVLIAIFAGTTEAQNDEDPWRSIQGWGDYQIVKPNHDVSCAVWDSMDGNGMMCWKD